MLTFDKAAAVTIDRKGLIYAADGRTGALHVFRAGRTLAPSLRA